MGDFMICNYTAIKLLKMNNVGRKHPVFSIKCRMNKAIPEAIT